MPEVRGESTRSGRGLYAIVCQEAKSIELEEVVSR